MPRAVLNRYRVPMKPLDALLKRSRPVVDGKVLVQIRGASKAEALERFRRLKAVSIRRRGGRTLQAFLDSSAVVDRADMYPAFSEACERKNMDPVVVARFFVAQLKRPRMPEFRALRARLVEDIVKFDELGGDPGSQKRVLEEAFFEAVLPMVSRLKKGP